MDLGPLLLPEDMPDEDLVRESRRIYFEDLVVNPPVIPAVDWMQAMKIHVNPADGAFLKMFSKTEGWASYQHRRTNELCRDRMRRAPWIRPVLELQVPKTDVYSNHHSMGPREFGLSQKPKKNRVFVATNTGFLYFVSLVWMSETHLVLATAFQPDGQWLRSTLKKHNTVRLGPPMHWRFPD